MTKGSNFFLLCFLYRCHVDQPDDKPRDAEEEGDLGLVPVGPLIADDGNYSRGQPSNRSQPQGDQHQEKEDCSWRKNVRKKCLRNNRCKKEASKSQN